MIEQVDINDFFRRCGPTSTPILPNKRISRTGVTKQINCNQINVPPTKDATDQLLESKDVWPVAFATVCQDFLNDLQLGLDGNFLIQSPQDREKSRRLSPMILRRNRSLSRDRSMSPSGARKMKESKWDFNMELALLMIEEVLKHYNELPDKFMSNPQVQCKDLLSSLSKKSCQSQRAKLIRDSHMSIIGQCLRTVLNKMGVLLPDIISKQLLIVGPLTRKIGGQLVKSRRRIEAAQTLMLNIANKSRILLVKIVKLFHLLAKIGQAGLNIDLLAQMLRPCLFAGSDSETNVQICRDFIALSDRVFDSPSGLLKNLKDKINVRPGLNGSFDKTIEVRPTKNSPHVVLAPVTVNIHNFFTHKKTLGQRDPVVLTAVTKISSPENNRSVLFNKSSVKRKSLTEMTRQIYIKSISPFKKAKAYEFSNPYRSTKLTKIQ